MKTMTKRTAVAALTGVMAVGMLTGCGEKKLDGTKTVATVDGTEIPLGIVSLSVREDRHRQKQCIRVLWADRIILSGAWMQKTERPMENRQ